MNIGSLLGRSGLADNSIKRFSLGIWIGLLLLMAACGGPATGTLQVNITGLPSGVNASVSVSGPNSFSQALTATTTLNSRGLGSYTVTATNVSSGGLTYIPTITGSPATVAANATATVSVTYAINPASLGTLLVSVNGVPAGATGSVVVSGPNSFSQNLSATTTLNGLVPGNYTITANNIPGAGATANFTFGGTVTGSPAVVSAGNTVTATVNYGAITGALTVTISGLPAGVNANVVVTGPNNFSQTLTATTTIPNLAPGNYGATTNNVRLSGAIVDAIFSRASAGLNAMVTAGNTAGAIRTYAQRGGTGALWIPENGSLSSFSATQLGGASGALTPLSITQAGINQQAVFDTNGKLYVSNSTNAIHIFSAAQIDTGGAPTPVTITGAATTLNAPYGMAFDSSGNLWVTNVTATGTGTGDSIMAFAPAALASGGNVAPIITIKSAAFLDPAGLAFDSSGNLWVSNTTSSPSSAVIQFTPAQLVASGSPLPAGAVQAAAFNKPAGLAFDPAGNLWVANFGGNNILKFTSAQLSAGGIQTANITLDGFTGPKAVAFDNGGNLWAVLSGAGGPLVQITAANLAASGSPTPAKTFTGAGSPSLAGLAFSPTPSNLPIQNK